MMHGRKKSDSAIVAGKPTNKAATNGTSFTFLGFTHIWGKSRGRGDARARPMVAAAVASAPCHCHCTLTWAG
jgi:hypothetical protein